MEAAVYVGVYALFLFVTGYAFGLGLFAAQVVVGALI